MSPPVVTIIGSLNYDLVTFTNKVPEGGETFQANSFETHMGGKGLNEATAVSKLSPADSIITRMVGKVGDDTFGESMKSYLRENKVDVTNVETLKGISSGVAVILVEQSGENRILITPGSNGELRPTPEEYEKLFPINEGFVILQNEYPDTLNSVNWLKSNRPKINIAYNPSPYKHELINEQFLNKIDLLIVNEGEAMDVARTIRTNVDSNLDLEQLAKQLHPLINQSNLKTVIITMGSKGCMYTNNGNDVHFESSIKVENVVDTTGAGDTFFGGVVSSLALGKTLSEAVKFATRASGLAIQKKGAAEGIPQYTEVMKIE